MPRSALRSLRLRHVRTALDPSLALAASNGGTLPPGTLAGLTEWSAPWGTTEAYVGWRWALLRDTLIVLDPVALRTNILIIEDGAPVAPFRNTLEIFEWIETWPWRSAVRGVIARS